MHAIDTDDAVQGQFTSGNPAAGQQATLVTAEWLNDIQGNLLALLAGAGIAPAKLDFTQVLKAVMKLAGGSANLAANGHVALPGGLVLNWGQDAHNDASGRKRVTFDMAFPGGPLATFATNNGGPPVAAHGTINADQTGMTVGSTVIASGAAAGAGTAFYWLAIGR